MYPRRELIEVIRSKAVVRARIATHRDQCAAAAAVVARPLGWLDRAVRLWRDVSPMAGALAWPIGAEVTRSLLHRHRFIGPLLRWAPPAFRALAVLRPFGDRTKT